MKIATFNANSIKSRLEIILNWLNANKPDVLCIQETKTQDINFPLEAINNANYNCVYKGQKAYNGVAIISPHDISEVEFGLDDEPADPARLIKAKINGINIVNTYVPQGRKPDSEFYQYKLQWFKRLKSYFEKRFTPDTPLIWTGDLNVAPEDIDVHNPTRLLGHVCFNPQLTEVFYDTVSFGFTDLFRLHNPQPDLYTYFDYRFPTTLKKNLGWRIDHILGTDPVTQRCTKSYIDMEPRLLPKPSDHTFMIAEIKD